VVGLCSASILGEPPAGKIRICSPRGDVSAYAAATRRVELMNHGGHLNVVRGVKIYCNACADLTLCQCDWLVSLDEKSRRSSSWTRSHRCSWDCDALQKQSLRKIALLSKSQESAETSAVILKLFCFDSFVCVLADF
jgi:hypothetical protein